MYEFIGKLSPELLNRLCKEARQLNITLPEHIQARLNATVDEKEILIRLAEMSKRVEQLINLLETQLKESNQPAKPETPAQEIPFSVPPALYYESVAAFRDQVLFELKFAVASGDNYAAYLFGAPELPNFQPGESAQYWVVASRAYRPPYRHNEQEDPYFKSCWDWLLGKSTNFQVTHFHATTHQKEIRIDLLLLKKGEDQLIQQMRQHCGYRPEHVAALGQFCPHWGLGLTQE